MRKKKIVKWKRLSVRIPEELCNELVDRSDLAGVSLNRLIFSLLKRKHVKIIPGFTEFATALKEICQELHSVKNDPELLNQLVERINQMNQMYQWALQKAPYPYIIKKNGSYKLSINAKKIQSHNLFEGD
jgi:hypothetical protein